MNYLKYLGLILFFIVYHLIYLEHITVSHVLDILASYSGRNAILLHMSVYIVIIQLFSLKYLRMLNSEVMIRLGREKYISYLVFHFAKESMIFLLLFYLCSSGIVIYYLGIDYYMTNHVYFPIFLSILTWLQIYLILLTVFACFYIFTYKVSISIASTTILSILSTYLFRQALGTIAYFEALYVYGMNGFKVIQSYVVLTCILFILIRLVKHLFSKKDLIYEDEI